MTLRVTPGPHAGFVTTTRQLLNGVLPDNGVNCACRPAAANLARNAASFG